VFRKGLLLKIMIRLILLEYRLDIRLQPIKNGSLPLRANYLNMKFYSLLLAAVMISGLTISNCQAQANSKGNTDNVMSIQRAKIDSLDKKLIEILGARQRAVREIGIYKAKNNIPPLQAARFQEVVRKSVEAGEKEGLSAEFITKVLNAIHEESLRIEESLK
jgi:chorismate mutase